MNRICSFILLVLVALANPARSQGKDEFVLVKKDGAISIYERWIIFPKSNPPVKAREVKSVFTFRNTIWAGLRLLQDEKKIQGWQSHVSEFQVYRQTDSTAWTEYSYHDIPWPVSDQDHYLHYDLIFKSPKEIFIPFESIVDVAKAPVRKGVTRMHLSGSWTFEQIGPNEVRATYRILSTPLNIPKFLTDPIIRNNMMTTIKEYIGIMEARKAR